MSLRSPAKNEKEAFPSYSRTVILKEVKDLLCIFDPDRKKADSSSRRSSE